MCGIAGIVGPGARARAPEMRAMRELIEHRGPDSPGEYVDDGAALGVRSLRVIDLVTGDQPIQNEDRTVWTASNGEIYNFRELREEFIEKCHTFATRTDTTVVVLVF